MSAFNDLDVDVVELEAFVPAAPASALREVGYRPNAWLPEEVDRLRAMFAADASIDEMARALGRPRDGVATKFYDLGLRRDSRRPWGELEDRELAVRYGVDAAAAIAQDLGRSPGSVYVRAQLLGLSARAEPPFTEWEDAQVRAGYERGVPVDQIARLIGRTLGSVNSRAWKKLKVRHANADPTYSRDEIGRMLELADEGHRYLAIRKMLVAEGFPERTKSGFNGKLRKIGYGRGWGRRWTPDEDELLRRVYANGESLTPLRATLGRSRYSIVHRARALGLTGSHTNKAGWRTEPEWTAEDEALLRARYGSGNTKNLVAELGRPLRAIYCRANLLGLKHPWMRAYTPDEDRAIAIGWATSLSLSTVAAALGRDMAALHKHAIKLGVRYGDPARPNAPKRGIRRTKAALSLADILAMDDGSVELPFAPERRPRGRPPLTHESANP